MKWKKEELSSLKAFLEKYSSLPWPARVTLWNKRFRTGRTQESLRGQYNRMKWGWEPRLVDRMRVQKKPRSSRRLERRVTQASVIDGNIFENDPTSPQGLRSWSDVEAMSELETEDLESLWGLTLSNFSNSTYTQLLTF